MVRIISTVQRHSKKLGLKAQEPTKSKRQTKIKVFTEKIGFSLQFRKSLTTVATVQR